MKKELEAWMKQQGDEGASIDQVYTKKQEGRCKPTRFRLVGALCILHYTGLQPAESPPEHPGDHD